MRNCIGTKEGEATRMTVSIIVALIGMFGACLASNGLWGYIQSKSSKKTSVETMVYALGKERLLRLAKKYLEMGYIPTDEFGAFVVLGQAYLDMNGNAEVKETYNKALELPRK